MKSTFPPAIAVLLYLSLSAAGQISQNKILSGDKSFDVQLHKVGGKWKGWKWKTDEISFKDNRLTSQVMSTREHFPPADCMMTIDSTSAIQIVHFTCAVKNPYISKIKWEGRIIKDKIEGTAVWSNGQGIQSYTFSGTLK